MKLEIKNLSFSYKNKEILNNISFKVYSGTLLSILGANGAGKTTLIKCINGILKLKKGEVLIDEKNFNNKSLKEKSKIMSYVPQIMGNLHGNKTFFLQPLAATINCTIWTSYGLLKEKKDYPLSAANLPGVIFGLLATITAF